MPSTYLTRTPSSSGNRKTWTFSAWIKRTELSSSDWVIRASGGGDAGGFYFPTGGSENKIAVTFEDSGGNIVNLHTSRVFMDMSAYYHIVLRCDTTQATEADRFRLYVNGVQETSFSTTLYPSQNDDTAMCKNVDHFLGTDSSGSANRWSGIMSHIHLCDGYSYGADSFGSTDATTGEWKINTSPNVSYGTTGFFILKDGNSVTDQSGQGNNWTVGAGTLTNTEDNPSNVFCTLNPLSHDNPQYVTTWGNTRLNTGSSTDWKTGVGGTIGTGPSGKYYFEVKWAAGDGYSIVGVLPIEQYWRCAGGDTGTDIYDKINGLQLNSSSTGWYYNYTSSNVSLPTVAIGTILSFAIDMDNKKMWAGKDGVWVNSGNPANGTTPTWSATEFGDSTWLSGAIPFAQGYQVSSDTTFQFNFGNGYFESTAITSEGTNASNIGKFEYDVPTGFTALCTKGLNE